MDQQNRNLILASVLSLLVIIIWYALFPPPAPQPIDGTQAAPSQTDTLAPTVAATEQDTTQAAVDIVENTAGTVAIATDRLSGHISLQGGRVNELFLSDYTTTLDEGADIVQLLSPYGADGGYYAVYGWVPVAGVGAQDVPSPNTIWTLSKGIELTPQSPVQLSWDNGNGLTFLRDVSVDENYMFTITQSVVNTTNDTIELAPYGILARHGEPQDLKNFFVLHEGMVQMADGNLTETDYDNMVDYDFNAKERAQAETSQVESNGWIGFTDHYWMTTLIPAPGQAHKAVSKYDPARDLYQVETVMPRMSVAAGQTATMTSGLFAGAKEWEAIRDYENDGIQGFVDSIDWGWFFFLTKPIFKALHFFNGLIGNMGWSIILLTLAIKAILLPLAYKSYVSMAKMKNLQPQMEELREKTKGDQQKMQQEMMALYKRENVNPAAGCLPILVQIPIFFSLYKVIFVTLELRHAPWLGWITDLSAPDPSSILNLFGLLSYAPPSPDSLLAFVSLGILPILLGISMWLQQKLNPTPTDPTQAMIFAWMPWVFMFMLGSFASGLVLYWIANNTITFMQQYAIMASQGSRPDLFGNILGKNKQPKK